MLATHLRQAATGVLESSIRIAPADAREWGQAMRQELSYIEGGWAAVRWALGGASVMAKHALLSFFIPGHRQGVVPGDELFAKNISLRKAALATGGAWVLGALLFFLAPPFRHGLRISLAAWKGPFHVSTWNRQPELTGLAKRAANRHDPEGLAFVAARLRDGRQSARLAEEAIRLDPSLTWVYAILAVRHPELPEINKWLSKLEGWDPQNALLCLIKAELVDIARVSRAPSWSSKEAHNQLEEDPAWQSAMTAAFASSKFDDYLDRLKELDRRVVLRYRFDDPIEMLIGEDGAVPVRLFSESQQFAKSLLRSGERLEVGGDPNGAAEEYWAVVRFGQLIDSQGHMGYEHWAGTTLQAMAYKQLQVLSQKKGNPNEAQLFGYLAGRFDPARVQRTMALEDWLWGQDVSTRNAAVLQISSLILLVCTGLILIAMAGLIGASRWGARPLVRRAKPVAMVVAFSSAVGLLLSAATVYLTYRPYWYVFQHAIHNGDSGQTRDLRNFLAAVYMLPGVEPENLPFYFWAGVTLLGIAGLVLILLRHVVSRPHPGGLQHSPRVP